MEVWETLEAGEVWGAGEVLESGEVWGAGEVLEVREPPFMTMLSALESDIFSMICV